MHSFRALIFASLLHFAVLILAQPTHADERMNGMVGLFYSSYNQVGFEYDLIAQFNKSKEWMGILKGHI